jgi:hypothetical protein
VTEHRRTASPLVALALGLGLLGLVLCVVPWTSASTRNDYVGEGSTSISQRSRTAANAEREQANPTTPGHGVLASRGKAPRVPPALRNPYASTSSGGSGMDWTHMPAFASRNFGVVVGDVSGLYPGRRIDLPVTFVNGHGAAILVRTAKVTATGTAQCGSEHLLLSDITFSTPIRVPARSSSSTQLPFGLLATAPDGCQDATFTVTVTAKATSA